MPGTCFASGNSSESRTCSFKRLNFLSGMFTDRETHSLLFVLQLFITEAPESIVIIRVGKFYALLNFKLSSWGTNTELNLCVRISFPGVCNNKNLSYIYRRFFLALNLRLKESGLSDLRTLILVAV